MTEQEKEIPLLLTFDEVNLIFKALGQRPFQDVYELIGKINEQVNLAIDPNSESTPLDPESTNPTDL